jgi:phosphohistidine phosphatase
VATARKLGTVLHRLGLAPEAVYTSPYLRARQTAQAIAEVLRVPVVEEQLLAPGYGPTALEAILQVYAPGEYILLVGHQPDLGKFVHWLTGAQVRLPAGGIAVVETPTIREGAGTLWGLYDPVWLE